MHTDMLGDHPYLICPYHNQQLSLVCLQKKCTNRLICGICEQQKYQNMKVTSLRTYLNELTFMGDNERTALLLQGGQEIKNMLEKCLKDIGKVRQQFVNQIERVEFSVRSYCNAVSDKLFELQKNNSRQHVTRMIDVCMGQNKIKEMNNLINKLKNQSDLPLSQIVKKYVLSSKTKFSSISQNLTKLSYKNQFSKICQKVAQVIQPKGQGTYKWSEFKGQKITINGMIATQNLSSSSGQRFALMQPQSPYNQVRVQFKIKKIAGWVGVGICLKNEIIKAGYKFNYTKTFHGSYIVSANGYSWSHSEPQMNSAYKGFTFAENDVVSVDYDSDLKQVRFENKTKSTKFTLQVMPAPPGDMYVPCVNLTNPGDEVEALC